MKFMQKLQKRGGFTLAEMLIVMAVVVVLAAATLPQIGSVLEGARESNDLSAIREAYTEAYTKAAMAIADESWGTGDAEKTQTVTGVKITQKEAGWNSITPKIADVADISASSGYAFAAGDGDTVDLDFAFTGSSLADLTLASVKKHTTTTTTNP